MKAGEEMEVLTLLGRVCACVCFLLGVLFPTGRKCSAYLLGHFISSSELLLSGKHHVRCWKDHQPFLASVYCRREVVIVWTGNGAPMIQTNRDIPREAGRHTGNPLDGGSGRLPGGSPSHVRHGYV